MNERARQAADRIREHVPIVRVLATYGYHVRDDGGDREQQFSCDLHGDGQDGRPSARVYPASNSWYCFACDLTRDSIQTVREKEGQDFWGAVKLLEESVGLEPLPYDGSWSQEDVTTEVAKALNPKKTWADDEKRIRSLLDSITQDRTLPRDTLLKFWGAFDHIVYMVKGPRGDGGEWSESKGRAMLASLLPRIIEAEAQNGG